MKTPTTRTGALRFLEEREPLIRQHAATMGLPEERAEAFTEATRRARAAYEAYLQARQRATEAMEEWNRTADASLKTGRWTLHEARALVKASKDPEARAALESMEVPTEGPAARKPRTPAGLRVHRDRRGRTLLRWKGATAGGTVFVVHRRVTDGRGRAGAWVPIGQVQGLSLIDEDAPAPAPGEPLRVAYRVRAERPGGVSVFCEPVCIIVPPAFKPETSFAHASAGATIARIGPQGARDQARPAGDRG
ncbi:MAG: hypothetical protein ACIAS6_00835, partial [Phycisphaerales bacterium JB060]